MGCSDKIIEKHKGDLAQRDIQRLKKIRKKKGWVIVRKGKQRKVG